MHVDPATNHLTLAAPKHRSHDHRCAQCGEPLVTDHDKARRDRELCIDCAYDTIACTD